MNLPKDEQQLVDRFTDHPDVQRALEDSSVHVRLASPAGQYIFIGPRAEEIAGYTESHLVHIDAWSLTHPDDREVNKEAVAALTAGTPVDLITRVRTKSGAFRWISNRIQPFGHFLAGFASAATRPADGTAYCTPIEPFIRPIADN